jgi:type IX secretion system PorP/SprF family membrane protein
MRIDIRILTFLFCGFFLQGNAQDIHYSQFYNAPLAVSPGLTGIFNGDQRLSVSLRDQWRSVPVPWFTTSLGFDKKFYAKKQKNSFFGGGLFFNYDRQGDSNLTLSNINLAASYNYLINSRNVLTFGLLGGYAFRGFDDTNLTWDNQWNGTSFDATIGSGEKQNFRRISFFESSTGVNYRHQLSSRTKVDLGVGIHHLIEPSVSFSESDPIKLPRRYSFYGIGSIQLTEKLDIQLDAMYQFQGPYQELLFGGFLQYYLNTKRGKQTTLQLGAGYRTSKALYPKIGIQFNGIFVAFSYDIDFSEFNQHTNGRGGPEVHFQYIITKVKPMSQFKVCPIF